MAVRQLTEVLATLDVAQVGEDMFLATQMDNPEHHIVGGHIAGQALMAAGRTVADRAPHSVHAYLLRAGDARYPVDFTVTRLRDGGTLSSRRVTGSQGGQVLLEAMVSFSAPVHGLDYQQPAPDVPAPESLPSVQQQLAPYAGELDGFWVRPRPLDLRYVDPPPRLALELPTPSPRIRMWWRPVDALPADPLLAYALLTYVSGTTMLETATSMRRSTPVTGFSALIDHALWFHRPVDLSDWVLSDQVSPSAVDGRALATATLFNRGGQLLCSATQEIYFGRSLQG